MNHPMTSFSRPIAEPCKVVHAGSMLLGRDNGSSALGRYLARFSHRPTFLVHHGQPTLARAAREAGVEDLEIEPIDTRREDDYAAEMAVVLEARELEFTIDRPSLKNIVGNPIGELTLHEAERLAEEPTLRRAIRDKLLAACDALRRGVDRVRFGTPMSLLRNRATVILPDPPLAMGAALDSDDDATTPDRDPQQQPLELPARQDEAPEKRLFARPLRAARKLRFAPQADCEIGPRRFDPFSPPLPRGYRHLPNGYRNSSADPRAERSARRSSRRRMGRVACRAS